MEQNNWPKIIRQISSPMRFFGLVILVCSSIFGVAAAFSEEEDAFTYSIHMFLAIVGIFILTAIWSPASLYHPQELKDIDKENLPKNRPWVPTISFFVGLLLYIGWYILCKTD